MQPDIILASSSPYRKELLERLHLKFSSQSPEIDEDLLESENATDYVVRLAREKAQKIATKNQNAIIIGSDQCALLDDEILGKPSSPENALQQLKNAQGRTVVFHTGLCVLQESSGFEETADILYEVTFRKLTDDQLWHYLLVEQPFNCAGSFKSEAYGVALFSRMRGDDPTALIGLPLIRLTSMLENAGVMVLPKANA